MVLVPSLSFTCRHEALLIRMAQARNGCPFMPTCGHVFARRGVVVGAPDAGSVDLDECVDGVAPLGHLVAVIVDLPSSALWAVPLTVAIGTVDGRQETAGHACYESTAKRAKPPLRAALHDAPKPRRASAHPP
jgi:hypothetical protein